MKKLNESKEKLTSVLSGVAGEYFVAAELTARGYIATLTLRNTKGVDILCSNVDASKTVGIQVKTNRGTKREWILKQKAEDYFADNLFYVFVNLNDNQQTPDYFIVPSRSVARFVKKSNEAWVKTPGRGGRKHIPSTMRKFADLKEAYLDAWDFLGLHLK